MEEELVEFGTVLLETDVEDITAPFRKDLEPIKRDMPSDKFERLCYHLTLFNNLIYEKGETYPKRISRMEPEEGFILVLVFLSDEFPDEKVENMEAFYDFWISYLNDNVDYLDTGRYNIYDMWKLFKKVLTPILEEDE